MSFFTALGRWAIGAADNVVDEVIDIIGRRAGDDLVDITPEVNDDFQDLGTLENLGQEQRPEGFFDEVRRIAAEPTQFEQEPQMTINITPEQQAGIDAIRARNADILRNTVDVDQFLSDPTNEAEARAQAALELIRAGRLDEVLANNNLVNALSDGDGEAYIARHSTRRYDADVDDDIVDADFEDIDIANAEAEAADAQSINIALRDNPAFQTPQVNLGVEQLRVAGASNFQIRNYLDGVKREYEEARRPVTRSIDATNTEQLRELYAKYKLPIPKTDAEALAAELIMEADRGILGDIGVSARRNIDIDYLKAHAPDDVYKKHGPTILEAKLAQQASVIPPLRTDKSRSGLPFYSAAARAAENLKVPSGSYEKLKKLALKQSGVKAKEFEWSGADEAFEGRTDVTPAELAEYLKQNSNLIREEQKMATGIMRQPNAYGGYDDGIDGFLDSQDGQAYIKDYLEMFEENFKQNFTSNTNMQDIGSYVAGDNFVALDKFAEEIDGVSSGRELAAKYPDGWIATDEYYGETKVFGTDEAAADWEWRENADSYDQAAREGAENNLNEMRVYDTDNFNMTVFGSNAPMADPAELEYASYFPSGGTDMTETRYVFDDPTGDLPEGYFKAGHFDDDENVVAHARAGEFPVETGGTAYHLGEAQSDVQQAARKAVGPTRTREQELFKDNYDSVKDLFRQYVVGAENDLSHKVFGGGIGRSSARFRDNPEALAEYKTIVADFLNNREGRSPLFLDFKPEDIKDDHSFFEGSKGNTTDLNVRLNEFAEYIQANKDKLPEPYTAWADIHTGLSMPNIQKQSDELEKLEASGINVEDTTVGAPMLESTDAWLDMVLRSQLSDAIASGADYLTLPNPQMVKDYTGGDFEGHRQFYGNIAPKNLMNVVKPADPTADFVPIKIRTEKQPEDVLGLPLTQDLITGLRKMGLPKYVVPFGGVGYGALGAMAEDEETAAGGGL